MRGMADAKLGLPAPWACQVREALSEPESLSLLKQLEQLEERKEQIWTDKHTR